MAHLTEKTFFAFAKCPRWVRYEAQEGNELSALEHALLDDSLLPEFRQTLVVARGEYVVVPDEDIDDAVARTLDYMRQGVQTIYGGTLLEREWVAKPDVLERVEGRSDFGPFYYVAIDAKRIHKVEHIKDTHKMQGVLYALALERVQSIKPTSGYILTPDAHVLRYDLETMEADTLITMQAIEDERSGSGEGRHVLTSGCKASPYAHRCIEEVHTSDDISYINRISQEEVEALVAAGVRTVRELAVAAPEALNRKIIDIAETRIAFLHQQAIALCERRHIAVEPIVFPEAETELFFDVEADPLRDADYLFGVWEVSTQHPRGIYHAFFADIPAGEEQAFRQLITFLEHHSDSPVYHYGWYEIEVMSRLFERYGCPVALEKWREQFVDVNALLRGKVIFPLPFYSLKDIGKYIGFEWRGVDVGGVQSIHWYHEWLRTGDEEWKRRICEYNEDDVRATWQLKKWLAQEGANMPHKNRGYERKE